MYKVQRKYKKGSSTDVTADGGSSTKVEVSSIATTNKDSYPTGTDITDTMGELTADKSVGLPTTTTDESAGEDYHNEMQSNKPGQYFALPWVYGL